MPNLNTNFTGSGIETTTPTVGAYGTGGSEFDMLGLSPELSKLLRTRIATAQANANTSMYDAQNAEMGRGRGGAPLRTTILGGSTPDPELGRAQAANQMAQQSAQEQQRAAQDARYQQMMLAQQAQSADQMAHSGRGVKRYGLTGEIIGAPKGTDEKYYLQGSK